ncbi:MAG TPA: hypothetical protein VGI27_02615 [Solirubrobacteraceae bacterium]
MAEALPKIVKVAKQRFELQRDQVERTMRYVLPEPITSHYVVIDQRRYPPKQVIGVLTGIDRADFTSHQARRILMGLGFAAGRRPAEDLFDRRPGYEARAGTALPERDQPTAAGAAHASHGSRRPDGDALGPFVSQWVATRGADVLVAASDPRTVVSWLAEHGQHADSMFRVPGSEFEASGLAPA